MMTSTPAPAHIPYDYTPQGIAEAWTRKYMLLDYYGAVEMMGAKKAAQMMREEERSDDDD